MLFLEHTRFAPFVNQPFTARREGVAVGLVLIQVHVKEHLKNSQVPRVPFVLVFRSFLKTILPQGIYEISGEGFDPMGIFIIPVGMDAGGVIYHAIFN